MESCLRTHGRTEHNLRRSWKILKGSRLNPKSIPPAWELVRIWEELAMIFRYPNPFEDMFAFQKALENRLSSNWMGSTTAGRGTYPPINVFQQGDDLVAILELPGVNRDAISVEAKENRIRIAGRKEVAEPEGASAHRRERLWGEFDRTIVVPMQIDPNGIKAEYRDGLLAIFIPRAEQDKPRTIKIS
jgi:HSP20 family protein